MQFLWIIFSSRIFHRDKNKSFEIETALRAIGTETFDYSVNERKSMEGGIDWIFVHGYMG